jgi:hypothetical protein
MRVPDDPHRVSDFRPDLRSEPDQARNGDDSDREGYRVGRVIVRPPMRLVPVLPIWSRVARRANCQVHPLAVEVCDKARDLSARFRWRIFEPENAEVLKADRG